MIPYGRQTLSEADIAAVAEALRSPFLTQGPAVPRFEAAVAARVGAAHAVAANSATSALHLAYLALGLGAGDTLWTTPNTFVATANAALHCGASVDFVDIHPATYLMDPTKLEARLQDAQRLGCLPKIVVPVHFAGQPCDMARIADLSRRYGFRIVEDASHAIGADYLGRPVGDGRFSDIAVFSFHPVKIVTTAEGGMAVTQHPALAERMRLLRSHGITKDPAQRTRAPDGAWDYEQVALGYNYRMSDLQGALGCSQIARIEEFLHRRRALASRYDALLADMDDVAMPVQAAGTLSSWHLYIVRLAPEIDRRRVFDAMTARGIGVQVLYIPVHTQPYYLAKGFRRGDFPEAERSYAATFTLPIFPTLTDAEQDWVVKALSTALAAERMPSRVAL